MVLAYISHHLAIDILLIAVRYMLTFQSIDCAVLNECYIATTIVIMFMHHCTYQEEGNEHNQ